MALKSGITMLILNKEDLEFCTEFPCLYKMINIDKKGYRAIRPKICP